MTDSRVATHAAEGGGSLLFRLWAKLARRPVDSFAAIGAGVATLVIIVNAVFLQSGSHPAPFFANLAPQKAPVESHIRIVPLTAPAPQPASALQTIPQPPASPARSAAVAAPPATQPAAQRRADPIAEFISSSPRVAAVQRVLSEYGYGQIKPSGVLDSATSAAIEKFEREHKMPVTGKISDRLVSDLAAMTGRPLR